MLAHLKVKIEVQVILGLVFFRYFGIKSWQRYLAKKVRVNSSFRILGFFINTDVELVLGLLQCWLQRVFFAFLGHSRPFGPPFTLTQYRWWRHTVRSWESFYQHLLSQSVLLLASFSLDSQGDPSSYICNPSPKLWLGPKTNSKYNIKIAFDSFHFDVHIEIHW